MTHRTLVGTGVLDGPATPKVCMDCRKAMSFRRMRNERTPGDGCPYEFDRGAVFFAPSLRGLDFAKQKPGGVSF